MDWLIAFFKLLWEQALFVILIPVVLIGVTLVLLPFEAIQNKLMADREGGNKFVNGFLAILGFLIGMIPVVLVIIYAFNKEG